MVKHEMVIEYYPYFETALKFVWALAHSGGGGAGARAEKERKREERDRDTPVAELPLCSYCGRGRHLVKNCRRRIADIAAKEKERAGEKKDPKGGSRDECWNCHKVGHHRHQCPEKRVFDPKQTRSGTKYNNNINMVRAGDFVCHGIVDFEGTPAPCMMDTAATYSAISEGLVSLLPFHVWDRVDRKSVV